MSWGTSQRIDQISDIDDIELAQVFPEDQKEHVQNQLEEAKSAAKTLLASGVCGVEGPWQVNLNGHVHVEGTAPDAVSVGVYAVLPTPADLIKGEQVAD